MKRKMLLAALLTSGALAAGRVALSQSGDDALDPLRVAGDTHRLAFENSFIHTVENVGGTEGHILRIELKF